MTEDDARRWIGSRFGAESAERIAHFLALVVAENVKQNLIAPSTIEVIWGRHALDSAQLISLGQPGLWIDIGTGGGFPGMVVALLRPEPLIMVEPRRRRAEFLSQCVAALGLTNARVLTAKVEHLVEPAAVISARAVAPIEKVLQIAAGCAMESTRWLLPRGRLHAGELDYLERHWRGVFHVEQSLTDPGSSILILDGVRTR